MFPEHVLSVEFDTEEELKAAIKQFKNEGYKVINGTKAEMGSSRTREYAIGNKENNIYIESILFELSVFTNYFKNLEINIYDTNTQGMEYDLAEFGPTDGNGYVSITTIYSDSIVVQRKDGGIMDLVKDSHLLENKIIGDFNYITGTDEFGGSSLTGGIKKKDIN